MRKNSISRSKLLMLLFAIIIAMAMIATSATSAFADSDVNTNRTSDDSNYPWYGYNDYIETDENASNYHDGVYSNLKVTLNGSKAYQVYCFNVNKQIPMKKDSVHSSFFKKVDGSGDVFSSYATNARLSGDALNKAILAVIYNGYPSNKNGIMDGLDELNAILVTQNAVWYYTDSLTFDTSNWANKYNFISSSQQKLMNEALAKLISSDLDSTAKNKVPSDYKLNLFIAKDSADQHLLSAEAVPDNPGEETENKTHNPVKIAKVDLDTGEAVKGASLKVEGGDLTSAITWVTDGTTKELTLNPGTYTLTETDAPEDYDVAEPIEFVVKDDYSVEIDGKAVDDLTVTMRDEKKETETPTETPVEKDIVNPENPSEIIKTVTIYDGGKVTKKVSKKPVKAKTKDTPVSAPKTGDNSHVYIYGGIALIAASVLVIVLRKRKAGRK